MFFLSLYPTLESLADYSINQYVAKHNYSLNDCVWCDYFSEIWKREPYSGPKLLWLYWISHSRSWKILRRRWNHLHKHFRWVYITLQKRLSFSGFIRASEFLYLLELIVHLWKAWFSNHQTFISRAFFSDSTDEFQPQLKITNFNLSPCFTSIIILNSELNWRKLIVFFHVITFQFASIKAKASKRTSNSPGISD